jgi:hypothetical protein
MRKTRTPATNLQQTGNKSTTHLQQSSHKSTTSLPHDKSTRPRYWMYFAQPKPVCVSFPHAADRGDSFGTSKLANRAGKNWLLFMTLLLQAL